MKTLNYIDLFAGAGGLSEGFIRQGFHPIAHVEMNKLACDTLTTRVAFHYLKANGIEKYYYQYLKEEIPREELLSHIPKSLLKSVINSEISDKTISDIFSSITEQVKNKQVDLIIGGPPCQAYSIVGRARDQRIWKMIQEIIYTNNM